MNYYTLQINPTKEWSLSEFKALMLMYLTSNDFDIEQLDDDSANLSAHLPYSLSNLNANSNILRQPIYSTEFQSTVERFDKPIVETGDLVLSVVSEDNEDTVSKYYNEFVKLTLPLGTAETQRPATKDEVSGHDTAYQLQGGTLELNPDGATGFITFEGEDVIVFIGVSNSSKSDFNNPFEEAKFTVIASQDSIAEILNKEV